MLALIDESTCKLGASLSVVEENHFADLVVVWNYFLYLLILVLLAFYIKEYLHLCIKRVIQ